MRYRPTFGGYAATTNFDIAATREISYTGTCSHGS